MKPFSREAANPPYKLPPPIFDARCRACWFTAALLVLVVASFVSLELDWAAFASMEAARRSGLSQITFATQSAEVPGS